MAGEGEENRLGRVLGVLSVPERPTTHAQDGPGVPLRECGERRLVLTRDVSS